MHNYHDTHKAFLQRGARERMASRTVQLASADPAVFDPALYVQFHLDEAWDSPHNKS